MPACLLTMCAHVAGYQAVHKRWETEEVSLAREDNVSVVNFPTREVADYAAEAFGRLKAEQSALLGAKAPRDACATALISIGSAVRLGRRRPGAGPLPTRSTASDD